MNWIEYVPLLDGTLLVAIALIVILFCTIGIARDNCILEDDVNLGDDRIPIRHKRLILLMDDIMRLRIKNFSRKRVLKWIFYNSICSITPCFFVYEKEECKHRFFFY